MISGGLKVEAFLLAKARAAEYPPQPVPRITIFSGLDSGEEVEKSEVLSRENVGETLEGGRGRVDRTTREEVRESMVGLWGMHRPWKKTESEGYKVLGGSES